MSFDQRASDGRRYENTSRDADSTGPISPSSVDRTSPLPQGGTSSYSTGADQLAGSYGDAPQQQVQSYGQQSTACGSANHGQSTRPGYDAQHRYEQPVYNSATTTAPLRRIRSRTWAAIPIVAILTAALTSSGTYVLTHDNAKNASASGGSTTVVQTNPTDFTDAGTVNWSATAAKVLPSVVSITMQSDSSGDQGSGIVLDKSGNVVTNNHVVTGVGSNTTIMITLNNNQTYNAKVIGTDPSTDLAVVRLQNPPSNLTSISMGDDTKLVVGQPVMAVGNPLGLSGTVTTGIVSALNRPITTQDDNQNGSDSGSHGSGGFPWGNGSKSGNLGHSSTATTSTTNAIQTSAAINPGNSGGALVNGIGQLIGINSSIATLGQSISSSQSGNIGIGFAIPVTVIKNISNQLIKTGKAQHSQLGVGIDPNPATVTVGNATEQAAKIAQITSDSPAARAGLQIGDIVTAFNGQRVVSFDSLVGFVRAKSVGAKVTLTIVRDGQRQNVMVTLSEASSSS